MSAPSSGTALKPSARQTFTDCAMDADAAVEFVVGEGSASGGLNSEWPPQQKAVRRRLGSLVTGVSATTCEMPPTIVVTGLFVEATRKPYAMHAVCAHHSVLHIMRVYVKCQSDQSEITAS